MFTELLTWIFLNILSDNPKNVTAEKIRTAFTKLMENVESVVTAAGTGLYKGNIEPTSNVPGDPNANIFLIATPGTYVNFKKQDGSAIVLAENSFGFIFRTNNGFVLNSVIIPQPNMTDVNKAIQRIDDFIRDFDITTDTEFNKDSSNPISAIAINKWLSTEVNGGQSNGGYAKELAYIKDIGVKDAGTVYASISNPSTPISHLWTNSNIIFEKTYYVKSAYMDFSGVGTIKIAIGSIVNGFFVARYISEGKSVIKGINPNIPIEQYVYQNEVIGLYLEANSTTSLRILIEESKGNKSVQFIQYRTSTTATAKGALGSFFTMSFELWTEQMIPVDEVFDLEKSTINVLNDFTKSNYFVNKSYSVGNLANHEVNTDEVTEGYAVKKIEIFSEKAVLKSFKINAPAGIYNFVIGVIDQFGKFTEKEVITKTLINGDNSIVINKLINNGDCFGLRLPSNLPKIVTTNLDLYYSNKGYTSALTLLNGYTIPLEFSIDEIIENNIATKSDLKSISNQNLTHNGRKVRLILNEDFTINWKYLGYANILHLGNSIALHNIVNYWWGYWGMAASKRENDYVHQFLKLAKIDNSEAVTFASNIADWEINPSGYNKSNLDSLLIDRDLIVVRLGENATYNANFQSEFTALIDYILLKNSTARILIGGVFWTSAQKDLAMKSVAESKGLTFVSISDLEKSQNKSFIGDKVLGDDGLEHIVNNSGVANHPNDLGMQKIAERLYSAL